MGSVPFLVEPRISDPEFCLENLTSRVRWVGHDTASVDVFVSFVCSSRIVVRVVWVKPKQVGSNGAFFRREYILQ